MKLKSDNRSVIQSNYNLTSTNFAIRAEDSPIIMEMMRSKIYSNKPAAVVREYTTNALDEHKLHNISRPVELKAPTANDPEFTVRDFGKGLTDQEVREIYVNYGCSTKRNTDDLTGGLGIGCKAGFAYGSQFSIISITKDDQGNTHKNAYMAIIDESNTGTLKHIESVIDNTLDTGVQIGVGIDTNDIQAFGKEIWNLWLTCVSKPKVLNPNALGPLETIEETVEILDDKTYYRTYKATDKFNAHNRYTSAVAVMGNIGYPINTYHLNNLTHTEKSLLSSSNLHIKFDISELNIASNREELEYNKETISNLESRIKEVFNTVTKNIVDMLNPIKCWMERQHKYAILRKSVNHHVMGYIDKQLVEHTTGIYTSHDIDTFIMYQYKIHGGVNRLFAENSESKHYCRIGANPSTRWIKDLRFFLCPYGTPKAQITRRLKTFIEQTLIDKDNCKFYVLFTKDDESKEDTLTRYKLPYISDKYVLNVLDYEPLPANIVARSSNSKAHVDLFSYKPNGYTDTDTWTDAGKVSLSSSSCVLFTYLSSVHAIKPEGIDTKSPHTNPEYRVDRDSFSYLIDAFNSVFEHLTDQERIQLSEYINPKINGLDKMHKIYGVRKNNWKVMKNNPNAINIFELTSKLLQRAVKKEHSISTLLSDVFQLRTCISKVHTLNKNDDSYIYRDPKFMPAKSDEYSYYRSRSDAYQRFYKLYNSEICVDTMLSAIDMAKTKKRKMLLEKLRQFAYAMKRNKRQNNLINCCKMFHNTDCLIDKSNKNRLKPDEFLTIIKNVEQELPLLEAGLDQLVEIENRTLTDQEKCVYQVLEDRSKEAEESHEYNYDKLCEIYVKDKLRIVQGALTAYMIK